MHLAFLAPPAPGHINPALPLVGELTRRGHRVSFGTGPNMADAVRSAGAEPLVIPAKVPSQTLSGLDFGAADLAAMLEEVHEQTLATYPLLYELMHTQRPDLVCFDTINPVGRILADELGVPPVGLVPNLASNDDTPMTDTFVPEAFDFAHPRLVAVHKAMAEFATAHGSSPDVAMAEVMAELNLVFVPRQFQPRGETFDGRFRFVGPSPHLLADAPQWRPSRTDLPLVYVSLGTVVNRDPDFFRACVEAFRDGTWQVAMAVGDDVDTAELGPLPDNFDVRPYFRQLDVLQHASVFVTHCGMGSTMEALAFGVPTVCAPGVPEQRINAQRVEELGLGRILPDRTAKTIRSLVDAVHADRELRERVTEMQQAVHACGGPTEGADALEEYATR